MLKEGHFLVESYIIKPIYMNKSLLIRSVALGFIVGIALYAIVAPNTTHADLNNVKNDVKATLVHNGHLTICKLDKSNYEVVREFAVVVTAYSSSWDETTGIPGKPGIITASGDPVAEGVVAYNHLPFGTKLQIDAPGFEGRVFVVKDRTAAGRRNLDMWRPSKKEALEFGAQVIKVKVLES